MTGAVTIRRCTDCQEYYEVACDTDRLCELCELEQREIAVRARIKYEARLFNWLDGIAN